MTNKKNGTLYIGVTNNLVRRVYEHKKGLLEGFTKKYGLKRLVYYERYNRVEDAISREKQLKGWLRKRKIKLIEDRNKDWSDSYRLASRTLSFYYEQIQ
jgi:putative endonuclease